MAFRQLPFMPVAVRLMRRYPVVGFLLVVWRWWRRRSHRVVKRSVRVREGETITVRRTRGGS